MSKPKYLETAFITFLIMMNTHTAQSVRADKPVDRPGTPFPPSNPLHAAIWNKDFAQVKTLLANGADVNAKDENRGGQTALALAANENKIEIVKMLLAAGADVNAKGNYGGTALMDAVYTRIFDDTPLYVETKVKIVKLLLDAGADVNAKSKNGRTALFYAASCWMNPEVAKILLKSGADVNSKTEQGWTALMIAASRGHLEFTKILFDAGADIHAKNDEGQTARDIAVKNGNSEIIKLFDTPRFEPLTPIMINETTQINQDSPPAQFQKTSSNKFFFLFAFIALIVILGGLVMWKKT